MVRQSDTDRIIFFSAFLPLGPLPSPDSTSVTDDNRHNEIHAGRWRDEFNAHHVFCRYRSPNLSSDISKDHTYGTVVGRLFYCDFLGELPGVVT